MRTLQRYHLVDQLDIKTFWTFEKRFFRKKNERHREKDAIRQIKEEESG